MGRLALALMALLPLLAGRPARLHAAPAGPFAYITNFHSNTVSVIDTSTNTVAGTVVMPTLPDSAPYGITVSPSGTRAYLTNFVDVSVSAIDTSTDTVLATVPLGGDTIFPEGVAVNPAGTRVYVVSALKISIIDTSSNAVIAAIPGHIAGTGVAVSPDGSEVYIGSDLGSDIGAAIRILDTGSNTIVGTVPLSGSPLGIAFRPDGRYAYVVNGNHLAVIDTSDRTIIASVPVGQGAAGVAVNPAGNRVYVTNAISNTVSVFDTTNNTVIATIPVGSSPFGVSTTSDGSRVYVANRSSNDVSVINAFTNVVIATVPVGLSPTAFGRFVQPSTAPAATDVSLTSSQNPVPAGTPLTLSATVRSFAGTVLAGSVSFFDGTLPLGSAPLVPAGSGSWSAQLTISGLGSGSHSITALYSGDRGDAPSQSPPLTQTVLAAVAATTVTLSAVPTSVVPGQPLLLVAVVTSSDGSTPTGTVTFVVDGVAGSPQPLVGGTASLLTAPLSGGPHSAQAFYAGDATHAAAASAPLVLPSAGVTLILNGFTLTYAVQGCGSITPPSEQGMHLFGDTMLLTAVPCAGSSFSGWLSGPCAGTTINPCAVAMPPANLTITAAFTP